MLNLWLQTHIMVCCFHKPFKLLRNQNRGTARFDEILDKLEILEYDEHLDWEKINAQLKHLKDSSVKSIVL